MARARLLRDALLRSGAAIASVALLLLLRPLAGRSPAPEERRSLSVNGDRLLTAPELAELLAVPVSWVREHTRSGAIPHVQLGRYKRYDRGDVLAWVEQTKAGGGARFRRHEPRSG